MEKRFFIAVGIVIFVLVFAYFVRMNSNNLIVDDKLVVSLNDDVIFLDKNVTVDVLTNSDSSNDNSGLIGLSELSNHDNEQSCWVVYDGKVYDITSYLSRHPGGKNRILVNCRDSTAFEEAFVRQHGTSKVGLLMKVGTFIGDFDIVGRIS